MNLNLNNGKGFFQLCFKFVLSQKMQKMFHHLARKKCDDIARFNLVQFVHCRLSRNTEECCPYLVTGYSHKIKTLLQKYDLC